MRDKEQLRDVKVYDSLRETKSVLEPVEPGRIKMYVCGVTVYDLTHIGHARVFIVFDVVYRFLKHLGYDVQYVRNHTDVDDKIIERSQKEGVEPLELAAEYIDELDRDMDALRVQHPEYEPKVSEHVDEIIDMVERLVDKGYAYVSDGDVYYDVTSFDEYGKLSGRKLDEMEAGRSGRVEENEKKKHPFDFALWKKSGPDEPGWDSPWNPGDTMGRPGWHIECSVMSTTYLGDTFDIHGGGSDLIFPHHENEIAQAEAATGCEFTRNWMHVGMINVAEQNEDGELVEQKMSKSLGNFWTTREVLERFHPDAIRYFMHTTHYRKPIVYSLSNLEEATGRTQYLYSTLERLDDVLGPRPTGESPDLDGVELPDELADFRETFESALSDDFNTSRALAAIGEVAKIANDRVENISDPTDRQRRLLEFARQQLLNAGWILGILQQPPARALDEIRDKYLEAHDLSREDIEKKIEQRKRARANQNYEKADAIRDELTELGIELMDSEGQTVWDVDI